MGAVDKATREGGRKERVREDTWQKRRGRRTEGRGGVMRTPTQAGAVIGVAEDKREARETEAGAVDGVAEDERGETKGKVLLK
jgi:hypothetical protein